MPAKTANSQFFGSSLLPEQLWSSKVLAREPWIGWSSPDRQRKRDRDLGETGNLILRLDAVIQQAGSGIVIVAACAEPNITPQGILVFEEQGVELLQVGASKDAADQALLERARSFASHGHTRFMVASGDGTFGGSPTSAIWRLCCGKRSQLEGRDTLIGREEPNASPARNSLQQLRSQQVHGSLKIRSRLTHNPGPA